MLLDVEMSRSGSVLLLIYERSEEFFSLTIRVSICFVCLIFLVLPLEIEKVRSVLDCLTDECQEGFSRLKC